MDRLLKIKARLYLLQKASYSIKNITSCKYDKGAMQISSQQVGIFVYKNKLLSNYKIHRLCQLSFLKSETMVACHEVMGESSNTNKQTTTKGTYTDIHNPNYHVEEINERSTLGEGPYWDGDQQLLYWVDMRNMWINSYSPETNQIFKAEIESDLKPVTLAIRVKDTKDKFVVGLKGALALVQWDGRSNAKLKPVQFQDVEDPQAGSRTNDGKVDPANRLWVGTMGAQTVSDPKGNEFEKDKGGMYRIDYDGSKHKSLENMQIANGLDWSLDKTKFYLVDSLTFIVYEYAYDNEKGTIRKIKDLYNLEKEGVLGKDKPNSLPDGMTIDNEGLLWVAVYGTGKVIRIDPTTSKKVFEIQLDKVLQPTSVCFGGKDLDILFVTSARVDWTDDFENKYPKSGYTFKITNLGVKGAGSSRPVKLDEAIVQRL